MKITPIYHDGFVAELPGKTLLFDYWKGEVPTVDPKRPIYVFASHAHPDHFSFAVFTLFPGREDVTYLLSKDIHRAFNTRSLQKHGVTDAQLEAIRFLDPEDVAQVDDLAVRTLPATDRGVAFVVETEGLRIYHAGDLNDWRWPKNTEEENQKEFEDYARQIDKLSGMSFDAAFVPLDPRQENYYAGGFDYFMRHTDTKAVYPMHNFGQPEIVDRFLKDPVSEPYRDRIVGGTV